MIQKQIAALSGDNSEEARARLQKLQVQLEEAQDDLKETEYDRWLSDQEDMLDSLADEMEDFWESLINGLKDNINSVMDGLMKMVADSPGVIADKFNELGLGDALSVITSYNEDGTHTDKTTDYGGNSYSSTYDKNGTNTGNKLETSINSPEPAVKSPAVSYPGKIAGETAKEEAQKEALEKGAENIKTRRQIEASLKKCTPLKNQGTEFINKHTYGKYGNELNQYLAEKYGRVYTSWADMKGLADILGVKVSGEKVTSQEAEKICDALKDAGFAEGGIVSEINKAVKENGDDGIATLKKGEAVLTQEQTEALQEASERYTKLEPKVTPEQEAYLMKSLGIAPTLKDVWQNMEQASRAVEVSNCYNKSANVSIGDVHVHIDGSNVVDKESFRKTLRDYEIRSDIEQIALGDLTKGSTRNSMRYI
ncbi:hypothetical protein D7V86_25320 [bacterium D16-51]|nr:hypothetical protein D7V96_24910 [bacterium D16-59]RKI53136.1 hypothetical protein D7V86_25320 [bacterium D16-51]